MKVVGYRLELGGSDPAIFQHLRPIKPSMKRYTGKMMDMDAKKTRFLHIIRRISRRLHCFLCCVKTCLDSEEGEFDAV